MLFEEIALHPEEVGTETPISRPREELQRAAPGLAQQRRRAELVGTSPDLAEAGPVPQRAGGSQGPAVPGGSICHGVCVQLARLPQPALRYSAACRAPRQRDKGRLQLASKDSPD